MQWWTNGKPAGQFDFDDRGLAYGDGLFETIALRNGTARLLDYHLERFSAGALRLGISKPSDENIRKLLQIVVDEARDSAHGVIKMILTRGVGERGYRSPPGQESNLFIGYATARPAAINVARDGVAIRWCATPLARQPALAGIKHLNRLEQVLARSEWDDDDIAEGLMLDTNGNVICATMSNVFIVDDGELLTPALTHSGVGGVMRRRVLAHAERSGLDYSICEISPSRLECAAEVFLSNSQFGIWPVSQLDERRWQRGPVCAAIMQALANEGIDECAV